MEVMERRGNKRRAGIGCGRQPCGKYWRDGEEGRKYAL